MTINEAKADCLRILREHNVDPKKLTARTWSFEGLGYGKAIFVTIHEAVPPGWKAWFASVPKPSEGGYVPELANQQYSGA